MTLIAYQKVDFPGGRLLDFLNAAASQYLIQLRYYGSNCETVHGM
ncbi:hypothetical protein JDF658_08950 [Carboxydocella sp. JDF658]|nr:hypothetical protein JDF658_08950 [Carboxydocella sp. JDF658]